MFSDDHYIGGPVDVWALGVLLYFMVIGNMPFRAPTVPALRSAVLKGDFCLPAVLSLPCLRIIRKYLAIQIFCHRFLNADFRELVILYIFPPYNF